MSTTELIEDEISKVPQEDLDDLYAVIRKFNAVRDHPPTNGVAARNGEGLFEMLRRIKIQGPPDFSENLDLYLSGEKVFDPPANSD